MRSRVECGRWTVVGLIGGTRWRWFSNPRIQALGECPVNAGVLIMQSWEPVTRSWAFPVSFCETVCDVFTCLLNCTREASRRKV